MTWETVIGLETHVQLSTKTKLFSRASTAFGASPNTNVNLIKEKKSNKVLFAGKIAKPKFSSLRLDLKGIYYMPSVIKAAKSGDAAIIKSIIKILEREKIKVISSIFFNPELSLKSGNYTKLKPTFKDMKSKFLGDTSKRVVRSLASMVISSAMPSDDEISLCVTISTA